jgi:Fur family zinc uptake transcriptional regulator
MLEAARSLCAQRGVRLTGLRQTLLSIMVGATQPLTAYELIPLLEKQLARKFAPPSIYRTLDFLMSQRLVTRIESRNAYIACIDPVHVHSCIFLVCAVCGQAEELEKPAIDRLVRSEARARGFKVERPIIELRGVCARCAAAAKGEHAPSPWSSEMN